MCKLQWCDRRNKCEVILKYNYINKQLACQYLSGAEKKIYNIISHIILSNCIVMSTFSDRCVKMISEIYNKKIYYNNFNKYVCTINYIFI